MNLDLRYPSTSPQRALAEWLDSWAQQDWDRAVMASQPHWRLLAEDPVAKLRGAYDHIRLDRWSVPMKRILPIARQANPLELYGNKPFIVWTDVRCRVVFTVLDEAGVPVKEVSTTINARLIRETADGKPAEKDDPSGRWYVNPTSMTRAEADKTRERTLIQA